MRACRPSKTHSVWLLCALVGAPFVGCGPPDATKFDESDPGKLQMLVLSVNDVKSRDLKRFGEVFASSAQPTEKDRTAMKDVHFKLAPETSPVIEGDKATLKVLVRDAQDVEKATATWTAVKENGAWKLSAAPLQ